MDAYLPGEMEQKKLAAALANPSKQVRDKTCATLTKYVSTNDFENLELLRLWKALYYCLWLSDKQDVQLELAAFLTSLLHSCKDDESMLDFFAAFWRTVMREWGSLDQFRVNKFYSLMRLMLQEVFTLLNKRSWPDDLSIQVVDIIEQEVVTNMPNGPRFHLSDIILSELHKVTDGDCPHEVVELVMAPFFQLMATASDHVTRHRIGKAMFGGYLERHARELGVKKGGREEQQQEVYLFPRASTQLLQKTLFELASSTEHIISKDSRKALYELHGAFSAVTGIQFVEGDGDLAEVEAAAVSSSSSDSKGKKAEKKKQKKAEAAAAATATATATPKSKKDKKDSEKKEKKEKKRKSMVEGEQEEEDRDSSSGSAKKSKSGEKMARQQQEEEWEESKEQPVFIKAKKFAGRKPGYVFKNDGRGNIGYHLDKPVNAPFRKESAEDRLARQKKEEKERKMAAVKAKAKAAEAAFAAAASDSDSSSEEEEEGGKGGRRVSFGKNRSKAYAASVAGLRKSVSSPPAKDAASGARGVLKKQKQGK
jgi:ribosomal RNA-processing protein 1